MKNRLRRCVAVFLMVSLAGCGAARNTSHPDTTEQHRISENAKIGVVMTPWSPTKLPRGRYTGEHTFGSNWGFAFGKCIGGGLFFFFAPGCAVWLAILDVIGLAVLGVVDGVSAVVDSLKETPAEAEKPEKLAAERLAVQKSLASLTPFPERVRRYARKTGIYRELYVMPDEAAVRYANLNYFFGFSQIEMILEPHKKSDSKMEYWIHLSAEAQFVRTRGSLVVDKQVKRTTLDKSFILPLNPADINLVSTEIDSALDRLTRQVVDEWITPTLSKSQLDG